MTLTYDVAQKAREFRLAMILVARTMQDLDMLESVAVEDMEFMAEHGLVTYADLLLHRAEVNQALRLRRAELLNVERVSA